MKSVFLRSIANRQFLLQTGAIAGVVFFCVAPVQADELKLKLDYWLTAASTTDLLTPSAAMSSDLGMPVVLKATTKAPVNTQTDSAQMSNLLSSLSNEDASEPVSDLVGEGDQILINVFGQADLSADVVVGASGFITLPLVGAMEVKGRTASDIAQMFATKLEQGQYLLNPKVSARVVQQVSRGFSVMGEVARPGKFPLQGQVSLLDAISIAGGLTQRADKQIRILRKRADRDADVAVAETLSINFDDLRNPEKLLQRIRPNDVIVVSQQKNFYIYGEVRKPGIYPVEEDLNVMRVLAIGGGVSERGSSSRIRILRKNEKGEIREFSAGITDVVLPGDVVFVNERIF